MALKIKSPVFIGTIVGIILSIIAFTLFIVYSKYDSAVQIRPYNENENLTSFMSSLRIDYNNLLSHYADQVKIISSAFAFIAFLVSYQNKNNLKVTPRAWGFFYAQESLCWYYH